MLSRKEARPQPASDIHQEISREECLRLLVPEEQVQELLAQPEPDIEQVQNPQDDLSEIEAQALVFTSDQIAQISQRALFRVPPLLALRARDINTKKKISFFHRI